MVKYKVTYSLKKDGQTRTEVVPYTVSAETDLNFQVGIYLENAKLQGYTASVVNTEKVGV